jgi:methyltransferase (TIGR00027 family)
MRDDLPSLTAAFVAFARGVGIHGDVPDPVAATLLPAPLGGLLDWVGRSGRLRSVVRPAARGLSFGLIDHLTLRTAAIDGALRTALAEGIDQMVILGAGLDARAWRMADLAGADVLEVDHPASQAYKRQRVEGHVPLARSVHFVSVDFERERLADALAASSHDPARPTFWLWEGVTMYLQREALLGTLRALAERSAPGSTLAVTYVLPGYVPAEFHALRGVVQGAFRVLGEPLVGAIGTEELHQLMARVGFVCRSDTCSEDWARAEGTHPELPRLLRGERLAVAVRNTG